MKIKTNLFYWLCPLLLAGWSCWPDNLRAQSNAPAGNYARMLKGVPFAELPARAAELISLAKTNELEETTFQVVKATLARNPASVPVVVGWIAKRPRRWLERPPPPPPPWCRTWLFL